MILFDCDICAGSYKATIGMKGVIYKTEDNANVLIEHPEDPCHKCQEEIEKAKLDTIEKIKQSKQA